MTVRDSPLIVVGRPGHLAALPRTALADVIVTATDERPAAELDRFLFAEYPGLAVLLIVADHRTVHLGSRDGQVLTVRSGTPASIRSAWLSALALDLYAERIRRTRPVTPHTVGRG